MRPDPGAIVLTSISERNRRVRAHQRKRARRRLIRHAAGWAILAVTGYALVLGGQGVAGAFPHLWAVFLGRGAR